MIGGQLDHLKISIENHFPRLRYGTLKFAFDRTQIKNHASLIGWQAYRGDQIHGKNSPTEPRNQIQVKYEKHLPGL